MVGLQIRASTTTQSYRSLDYAVYCRANGVFEAFESGSRRFRDSKQYGAGTSVLELSVTDAGRVQYIVDGHVAYTSTKLVPRGTDLHVAVAFHSSGAVTDIKSSRKTGEGLPMHREHTSKQYLKTIARPALAVFLEQKLSPCTARDSCHLHNDGVLLLILLPAPATTGYRHLPRMLARPLWSSGMPFSLGASAHRECNLISSLPLFHGEGL